MSKAKNNQKKVLLDKIGCFS